VLDGVEEEDWRGEGRLSLDGGWSSWFIQCRGVRSCHKIADLR
jgi:hypothetical protein